MHIATFDASSGVTQHLVQVEAQVKAETLVQPLLVLTHARPRGLAALAGVRYSVDHLETPGRGGRSALPVVHLDLQHVVAGLELVELEVPV